MFPQIYNSSGLSKPPGLPTTIQNSVSSSIPINPNLQKNRPYIPQEFKVPIIQKKEVNFNWVNYISLFFLVVFFIIIVVLLFINTSTKSKFIKPENCPVVKANYASVPSVPQDSVQIINNCSGNPDGYQGNKQCLFSNINSLLDAQNLCNKYQTSICSGFGYNPTTKQTYFINTNYSLTSSDTDNTLDVYIKQNA